MAVPYTLADVQGGIVQLIQHPARVVVWGAICSIGKSPIVFIEASLKLSCYVYLKIVIQDALKQMHTSTEGSMFFQQDEALSHAAKSVQEWCAVLYRH